MGTEHSENKIIVNLNCSKTRSAEPGVLKFSIQKCVFCKTPKAQSRLRFDSVDFIWNSYWRMFIEHWTEALQVQPRFRYVIILVSECSIDSSFSGFKIGTVTRGVLFERLPFTCFVSTVECYCFDSRIQGLDITFVVINSFLICSANVPNKFYT